MANTQKNKEKLKDMNPDERKAYNEKMADARKTNEFFKNTAEKRTDKVIKALRTVGFMGKYNGTNEQKENIIVAIDIAVSEMKSALYKESRKKETFKL
jgi:hypothetical protein